MRGMAASPDPDLGDEPLLPRRDIFPTVPAKPERRRSTRDSPTLALPLFVFPSIFAEQGFPAYTGRLIGRTPLADPGPVQAKPGLRPNRKKQCFTISFPNADPSTDPGPPPFEGLRVLCRHLKSFGTDVGGYLGPAAGKDSWQILTADWPGIEVNLDLPRLIGRISSPYLCGGMM
jgi:hypothetical protein